eukprot:TRINITY_DN9543_c0_g1_i1.p1 TRINITY_DN9543_c0_g1~~TRINITY_DN9543_c0_g1_i1.p1  ORF type:complete len:617 (-),score=178.54 TRINITY_DN9543_c0_g1_i1:100-1878(-)
MIEDESARDALIDGVLPVYTAERDGTKPRTMGFMAMVDGEHSLRRLTEINAQSPHHTPASPSSSAPAPAAAAANTDAASEHASPTLRRSKSGGRPDVLRVYTKSDCSQFRTLRYDPAMRLCEMIPLLKVNAEGRMFSLGLAESTLQLDADDAVSQVLSEYSKDPSLETQRLFFTTDIPSPLNPSPAAGEKAKKKKTSRLALSRPKKRPGEEEGSGPLAPDEDDARFKKAHAQTQQRDDRVERAMLGQRKIASKALERLGLDPSNRKLAEQLGIDSQAVDEVKHKPLDRHNGPLHSAFYETHARRGDCINHAFAASVHNARTSPWNLSVEMLTSLHELVSPIYVSLSRLGPEAMGAVATSPAFEQFQRTSAQLRSISLDGMNDEELTAFFANIFHTMLLHMSVIDPTEVSLKGRSSRLAFLKKCSYDIAGHQYTPWDILHGVLHVPVSKSLADVGAQKLYDGDPRATHAPSSVPPFLHLALSWFTADACNKVRVMRAAELKEDVREGIMDFFVEQSPSLSHEPGKTIVELPAAIEWYVKEQKSSRAILLAITSFLPNSLQLDIEEAMMSRTSIHIRYRPSKWVFKLPRIFLAE